VSWQESFAGDIFVTAGLARCPVARKLLGAPKLLGVVNMTDRFTGAGLHRRRCQVSGMDWIVMAVFLVVLAKVTGFTTDTRPPRADDSGTPRAAAISLDQVGIRPTKSATRTNDGAALPRDAVADRGGLNPVDRAARVDATDGRPSRAEAANMALAGLREQRLGEQRLFPRREPDDDRRRVLLLLILGVQQSPRASGTP
jgi:hypothetical protein